MNKERAKEELRDRKILAEIEYNQSEDTKKKDNLLRYIKALDIAIDSLDNEWVDVKDRLPNEDEMYYNGVRDYNNDTFRTSSDKVLAQDENGEIYCGYFMSSCWHHEYNGEGRIENKYTRYGEACWEFGVDDGKELIASIGTNIKIIAWKPLPKPYERKE